MITLIINLVLACLFVYFYTKKTVYKVPKIREYEDVKNPETIRLLNIVKNHKSDAVACRIASQYKYDGAYSFGRGLFGVECLRTVFGMRSDYNSYAMFFILCVVGYLLWQVDYWHKMALEYNQTIENCTHIETGLVLVHNEPVVPPFFYREIAVIQQQLEGLIKKKASSN